MRPQLDEPQRRLASGDDGVHAGTVAVVGADAAVAVAIEGRSIAAERQSRSHAIRSTNAASSACFTDSLTGYALGTGGVWVVARPRRRTRAVLDGGGFGTVYEAKCPQRQGGTSDSGRRNGPYRRLRRSRNRPPARPTSCATASSQARGVAIDRAGAGRRARGRRCRRRGPSAGRGACGSGPRRRPRSPGRARAGRRRRRGPRRAWSGSRPRRGSRRRGRLGHERRPAPRRPRSCGRRRPCRRSRRVRRDARPVEVDGVVEPCREHRGGRRRTGPRRGPRSRRPGAASRGPRPPDPEGREPEGSSDDGDEQT